MISMDMCTNASPTHDECMDACALCRAMRGHKHLCRHPCMLPEPRLVERRNISLESFRKQDL